MDAVEEQLLAYNARDLERFIAAYASEVMVEDGEGNVIVRGHDQMRERYGSLFESSPGLNCQIASRIRIGKFVVDEEQVLGIRGSSSMVRAVVIYQLDGDKISHVRMLN